VGKRGFSVPRFLGFEAGDSTKCLYQFLGFIREVLVDHGGLGFRVQVGRFGQRVPELGEVLEELARG
jgi:hypothetical protein